MSPLMRKDHQTGNDPDHWSDRAKLILGSLLKREVLPGASVYLRYPSKLSAAAAAAAAVVSSHDLDSPHPLHHPTR